MVSKIHSAIKTKGVDSPGRLGLVHVYYGDGKGKTTAALGLAMRAKGAGLRVHIIQFLKSGLTGELASARHLGFLIEQFGLDAISKSQPEDSTFVFHPDSQEQDAARAGWERAKQIISSGDFDLVVLDELCVVLDKGFISLSEVLGLIKDHGQVELVLTGRDPPEELLVASDYVNEVKRHKHPYDKGIIARKGIEY